MSDNDLVFTISENICYCGTNNKDSFGNAAKYPSKISGKIIIPRKFENHFVNEIGCAAFYKCGLITEIQIEARITKINDRAFSDCHSLLRINVPSSVTYIGNYGIHFYISNTGVPSGVSTVIFEDRRSSIEMKDSAIASRQTIVIAIANKIETTCTTNALCGYTTIAIYSKQSFSFCNVQTIVEPTFFAQNICTNRRNNTFFSALTQMIILLIVS